MKADIQDSLSLLKKAVFQAYLLPNTITNLYQQMKWKRRNHPAGLRFSAAFLEEIQRHPLVLITTTLAHLDFVQFFN